MRLEGKIALVTGASHGIGKAIALTYAREGADVAITYRGREDGARDTARQIEALGRRALVRHAEMTALDTLAGVVDATIAELGGLDVLVNNAGGGRGDRLLDLTLDDWRYTIDLCVTAPFILGQRAARHMAEHGGGAIVNISSVQGHQCQPGVAAYVATKGAIHALTRAMALDHAKQNIRVNSISPGSVRTPILELAARTFDGPDADIEAAFKRFGAAHPLGRIGEPEEVAEMIAFLCSDRAAFCTGGDYLVDGGLTAGIGVS